MFGRARNGADTEAHGSREAPWLEPAAGLPRRRVPIGQTGGSVIAIVGGSPPPSCGRMRRHWLGAGAPRLIGPWSTLGWVMLIGLSPGRAARRVHEPAGRADPDRDPPPDGRAVANPAPRLLVSPALRRGKVGVGGQTTEGAISDARDHRRRQRSPARQYDPGADHATGVVLAATERRSAEEAAGQMVSAPVTALLALGGAVLSSASTSTRAVAADSRSPAVLAPARVAGATRRNDP